MSRGHHEGNGSSKVILSLILVNVTNGQARPPESVMVTYARLLAFHTSTSTLPLRAYLYILCETIHLQLHLK